MKICISVHCAAARLWGVCTFVQYFKTIIQTSWTEFVELLRPIFKEPVIIYGKFALLCMYFWKSLDICNAYHWRTLQQRKFQWRIFQRRILQWRIFWIFWWRIFILMMFLWIYFISIRLYVLRKYLCSLVYTDHCCLNKSHCQL